MIVRDQNGKPVYQRIRRVSTGWAVNVWRGGEFGPATNIRRHVYRTRAQARDGDVSDDIGRRGRIA